MLVRIGPHLLVVRLSADPAVPETPTRVRPRWGTTRSGGGFDSRTQTFSAGRGDPVHVAPGGRVGCSFILPIEDSAHPTALGIPAAVPFRLVGTAPTLPAQMTTDDGQPSVVM